MRFLNVTWLLLFPLFASTHHSAAEYDSVLTELEGTVDRVQWMNPHVRLILNVPGDDGSTERWQLEGMDATRLDRAGLPHDLMEVGAKVVVAGRRSTRRPSRMFVENVLLPDGLELLLFAQAQPRWSERVVGSQYPMAERSAPVQEAVEGIFRVWTPSPGGRTFPAFASDPPFTSAGRAAYESFDLLTDDPILNCTPPGMPRIMTRAGSRPIEFVNDGDRILIRVEAFAQVREIEMTGGDGFQTRPPRPLGYSWGRWEDNTLVITTTRIDWPRFNLYGFEGAPQSPETEIIERFTLSGDERELVYDITANEPLTFTEPVTAERYQTYGWRPGMELMPYGECGDELE